MMYGERRFIHFWVDILIVLHIFGFGTARLGEWRLNHIHSINGAEVINASVSDSSAEIDYSTNDDCAPGRPAAHVADLTSRSIIGEGRDDTT